MPKSYSILLCLIFISTASIVSAQNLENNINLSGINYPQEKIHIHFDKESYLPGETIWFKAYLLEENLPSAKSTNFYAALYDDSGRLVQRQVNPIFGSTADGHFDIPDSLKSSQLICRAYTGWMLNFDTSLFFTRSIKIISNNQPAEKPKTEKTVSLHFFPEGGDIIEGTLNTIAFKANYDNGLPYDIDGVIKKQETGEVIMPLKVQHDGMGKFNLLIQAGEKYYAEWVDNKGSKQQTWLPAAKGNGVSLKLTVQQQKLYYNIINQTGKDSLHVLMYMYQKVFYKRDLRASATEPFTGTVTINSLPTGTMQLTVFDADWQPVAERITFINNNNFTVNAAVNSKEVSLQKRGKNMLEILVADTIPANLSLSITDADMNAEYAENTILSDFLLKSDIKGYVHNPAYYFTSNTDSVLKAQLDLVMLTNGWRRYNWADMMVQKMPSINFPADDYLGIYGYVSKDVLDKLEKDEPVNLIIKTVDSTNTFYSILPDKSGYIRKSGLIFYDTATVYFSFNKNKLKNRQIAFSNNNFLKVQPLLINNYSNYLLPDAAYSVVNLNTSLFKYYAGNNGFKSLNGEKTLKAVVVKTGGWHNWKNDPLLKLDEKYASGLFAGGATAFAVDVLHDEASLTSIDIYSYLFNKIPTLSVVSSREPGEPKMLMHRFGTPAIYIDGSRSDNSYLGSLPVDLIAYIKFFESSPSEGIKSGGIDASGFTPVLVIYLKKGDDLNIRRPKDSDMGKVKVSGYTPRKEFYSPDYELSNTTDGTDARSTLLWMPYILTDANNRKVPVTFYNNDFTKKFRVVMEGINAEGKMVRIEKIIE